MAETKVSMLELEKKTGKGFGSGTNPLLISVRSGSSMSMPGMMDTILNLGLNEASLKGLIKQTGNARFAYDAYRRFIQLFGKIALNISDEHFESVPHQAQICTPDLIKTSNTSGIGVHFAIAQHHRQAFLQDFTNREIAGRGVRLVDGQTRGGLSQAVQDHQGSSQWHGSQYLHHGVRQHGQ
jgi:phosphoenolpyruvate synthase/pyruvate phosphate dikinase